MIFKNEKRSETLEVRIGYNAKRKFMDACQKSGFTASSVLRGAIGIFVSVFGAFHALRCELSKRKRLVGVSALSVAFAIVCFAVNPLSHTGDRPTQLKVFNQIDTDRKGYFTLSEFYVFSGMTSEGELSDQDRAEIKATFWANIEPYRDTIAAERATPEFLEGVIANTEMTTAESLTELFLEMDLDQDGMITPREFLVPEESVI